MGKVYFVNVSFLIPWKSSERTYLRSDERVNDIVAGISDCLKNIYFWNTVLR